jgi:hypothetical protein
MVSFSEAEDRAGRLQTGAVALLDAEPGQASARTK